MGSAELLQKIQNFSFWSLLSLYRHTSFLLPTLEIRKKSCPGLELQKLIHNKIPPNLLHICREKKFSNNLTRQTLPTSTKLTYLSVYDTDSRDGVSVRSTSPSPPSSLTHVHRCIGSHNTTRQTLPTSAKLTSLSMYDNRNGSTQCMWDV